MTKSDKAQKEIIEQWISKQPNKIPLWMHRTTETPIVIREMYQHINHFKYTLCLLVDLGFQNSRYTEIDGSACIRMENTKGVIIYV